MKKMNRKQAVAVLVAASTASPSRYNQLEPDIYDAYRVLGLDPQTTSVSQALSIIGARLDGN